MCFFVQTNHTRKELLFLMFKEINLRNHSSLHKLFYSLLNIANNIAISPITQIVILFLLYILDILQKIKRSVIIEKTVSNNIQKKLITMMVSMMLPYTFFIYLPKRFRVKSNKIHKRTISTFTAFNNILS